MEIILTAENFENEVINSNIPVLVDFYADWCGPCRMLAPVISQIAEEYAGKVKVGKLNVDEQGEIANRFGIQSIPTVIVFKNGKAGAPIIGYNPKDAYVNAING